MKDRIKQIREHFGLSQAHFAQRIQKSPGFISLVETGKSDVFEETIATICSVLPVNKEWLLTGEGEMTSQAAVDMENIGIRIKQLRKDLELTQKEFAAATGYTNIQIHLVESGRVKPSDKFLQKVGAVFGVSQEWLMTGVGDREAREDQVDDKLIAWLNFKIQILLFNFINDS